MSFRDRDRDRDNKKQQPRGSPHGRGEYGSERFGRRNRSSVTYSDDQLRTIAISAFSNSKKAVNALLASSISKKNWRNHAYDYMVVSTMTGYLTGGNKHLPASEVGNLTGWKARVGRKIAALKLLRSTDGGNKLENISKLITSLEALHRAL